MTEKGDPKENPIAERINSTIKNELLKGIRCKDIEELRQLLARRITFYNERRPHMSVNNMTPAEASKCVGEIKKLWKSIREEVIKENFQPVEKEQGVSKRAERLMRFTQTCARHRPFSSFVIDAMCSLSPYLRLA